MAYHQSSPGRLLLFALSTGPHCRAARNMLDRLKAPFDGLEVDLLPEAERELALEELTLRNPAQTFPTILGGTQVVAGALPGDLRRLAARFPRVTGPPRPGPAALEGEGKIKAMELYKTLAPAQAAQGYALNPDPAWTLEALAGLLANEARYGYASCPGRLATGRLERDRDIICPCAFRARDAAKYGHCHCRLYFSPGAAVSRITPVPDRWLR